MLDSVCIYHVWGIVYNNIYIYNYIIYILYILLDSIFKIMFRGMYHIIVKQKQKTNTTTIWARDRR